MLNTSGNPFLNSFVLSSRVNNLKPYKEYIAMKNLIFLFLSSLFLFTSCTKEKISPSIAGQWELKVVKTADGAVNVIDVENRQGSNILFYYYVEHGFEFYENGEFTAFQISEAGEVIPYSSYYEEAKTYEISDGHIHFNEGRFNDLKLAFEFISADAIRMKFLNEDGNYPLMTNLYFERID